MTNGKPSAADVAAEAKAAFDDLAGLERKLAKEINAIDFKAAKERRNCTPDEQKRRDECNAGLDKVGEAYIVLAYDAAKKYDSTADVLDLSDRMAEVNGMLTENLNKLKKIEAVAATAAKVADTLAKAAVKLAEIAAKGIV